MLHAIETEQRKSRKSTRIGDTMDAMKSWTPLAPGTALPLDRPLVFLESTVIAQGRGNLLVKRERSGSGCKTLALRAVHVELRIPQLSCGGVNRLQRPPCCTGRRRAVRLKSRGPTKSRERRARTHASERERSQSP